MSVAFAIKRTRARTCFKTCSAVPNIFTVYLPFNCLFPIVDSHNELHKKDMLWTEENLQTSNDFGAESSIESHESRQLPNKPQEKRSRAVSLVSVLSGR